MRIAVVGSGIAGLASAWLLGEHHEVTLFEANDYLGGHTHTHCVTLGEERLTVDTGFIVHNPRHYPLLSRMFAQLGVQTEPTTMSFSVRNERTGLEYKAATLRSLFCQKRNLFSPRFHGMLRDIVRFYREAPRLLDQSEPGPALGQYLQSAGYGDAFGEDHLIPMAAALWSAPPAEVLEFPASFLVRFMANHDMLRLGARPCWRVVRGGSASYVRALEKCWRVAVRRSCAVTSVRRVAGRVAVQSAAGSGLFDHIVLACHSDEALRLLSDATPQERRVLGAIRYQPNAVVLHTDATFLPRRPQAWAAWNALVPSERGQPATVSYLMNQLQGLKARQPLIVTLNPTRPVAPERILRRMNYSHPLFTPGAIAAQGQKATLQGQRGTWFAGAYWGFGFHEDGLRSAVEVAEALGVQWQQMAVAS
ncbi:MAG TPA: FAD-dependent oxidoreductase [Steroidobacteraceae bacterium]|nr:FAD-dependent oxidoreductase [Steroidobacteraceae bacterium]